MSYSEFGAYRANVRVSMKLTCRYRLIHNLPVLDQMLVATARAEDRHYWFRGLRRNARQLLREAMAGREISHIVDCGAGTGRNLEWLREFGDAVGVERSAVGIEFGRKLGRRLVRGTVDQLPFPDASMDLATSFDVLYCLDDQTEKAALAEMRRVLKPGGLVMVNVAALDILRGSHSTLTMEVRRYTKARLRQRLTAAGFVVNRMTFTNMTMFAPAFAVRWLERMTGRAETASESDLTVPPPPVNAVLNAALTAEAAWLRVANLPIGTSLMAVATRP